MALPGDLIEFIAGAVLFFILMTPDTDLILTDAENIAHQASDFSVFIRR